MTKFKKRLIKIGIIALMPILALLLCLNNTYAYYLDNDGNIRSNNLLDNSLFAENYGISSESGNLISINGYKAVEDYIKFDSGVYSKTLGIEVFIYDSLYTYLTNIPKNTTSMDLSNYNDYVYCRFEALSNNNDLMINQGSTLLSYEPYGVWYQNDVSSSLYYAFENAKVDLYNSYSNNLVLTDYIHLSNNSIFILQNDCSLIANYLNSYEGDNRYFYVIIYLNVSIDNNLVVNCYQDFMDTNLLVSSSTKSLAFERLSTNDYIEVRSNFYYNQLQYNGLYSVDYVNFSINLDLMDITYSLGYNEGYNEGYKSGNLDGKATGGQSGYIEGYNKGLNDGAEQNLETNGMKTLFNSILSYPVNMIRSVFNFDFMGVNISSIIMFVISVGIVIFVIRKFKE